MSDKNFLPVIILVLGIFLSAGWHQFIYEPARREILNMELETRQLREIEREILELKANHKDLSTFVEERELQLDEARIFLPATLSQDKFIDNIYRKADFCEVRIIFIQTSEIILSKEIQSQIVTLRLEADYVSLMNFIREMIDGERLTSLENFSVEDSKGNFLSCELNFKILAVSS